MPTPSRATALVFVLVLALAGCGGADEVTMPPLTPEPGEQLPTFSVDATPLAAAETLPARLALYKFLRGLAAGDTGGCAHLAPEYEAKVFGAAGGCRTGLAQARSRLSAQDVAALRGVTVPTAQPGSQPGDLVVAYTTLRWRTAPARPGGLLASQFTLRQTNGRWLIVA